MRFNNHSRLAGQHAFLSASKSSWINYDEEKLDAYFTTAMAAKRGSDLHELAASLIRLGVKLPKSPTTMNLYVNDAIGFRMVPEQTLWASDNAFGTADAISFRGKKLRIHDLKTGVNETGEKQLKVYAAFFCIEYRVLPFDIDIELRVYQNDEVRIYEGDPDEITHIMSTIATFDRRIKMLKEEADL